MVETTVHLLAVRGSIMKTLILRSKNNIVVCQDGKKLLLPLESYINMNDEEILKSINKKG